MNVRYDRDELREGTAARLRQQMATARSFLDSIEMVLAAKKSTQDTQQLAEGFSSTTDRILSSCTVLRALDSLK